LGAQAALESLRTTNTELLQTQNAISTGKKVSSAADNPAIYAIAQTMNANIAGLTAVSDSLNFGAQVVNAASAAAIKINGVLSSLQSTVTSAGSSGLDLTTLQQNVSQALTSIDEFAKASTFSGVNLLAPPSQSGVNGTLNIVQSVDGSQINVANQATTVGGSSAASLTAALGLAGLNVASGGGVQGVKLSFNQNLAAGTSFANGSTLTINTSGNKYVFEFNDGTAALQTSQAPNTTVVAVSVNPSSQSTNQMISALSTALQQNGFGVVTQSDGSLDIVGNGINSSGVTTGGGFSTGTSVTSLNSGAAAIDTVQTAITKMNRITTNLGSVSQQISGMSDYTSSLSSALTSGVSALTDADMAAESAKLQSLQTKQQLAMQSLSIANQAPQSLLSLFR
jgi:flagellin